MNPQTEIDLLRSQLADAHKQLEVDSQTIAKLAKDKRRFAKLEAINADLLAALYSIATEPSAIHSGANAHIGDIARAAIAKATATQ